MHLDGYTQIHLYLNARIHTCTLQTYMYLDAHSGIQTFPFTHKRIQILIYTHTHTHRNTRIHSHTNVDTFMHVFICLQMYVHDRTLTYV